MTDPAAPDVVVPPVRRRRGRRIFFVLFAFALLALFSAETYLRLRYGLGNPPVLISDTQTEYRLRPDSHYRRLGHRIDVNAYSMRSEPFPPHKASTSERRVIVLGDSVINGGAWTDQADLATSMIEARLRRDVAPSAIVGNVSAGSWGPQNLLGYVDEFGLFDADVVVIVVSSHDAFDEVEQFPTRSGVPSQTYWFALSETWDRLRPQWTPATTSGAPATTRPDDPPPNHQGASGPCLAALGELIDRIRAGGARPIVALHYERPELDRAIESEGHRLLRGVCASRGIEPISLAPGLRASIAAGRNPYRDEIHPNEAGQRAMAAQLIGPVEDALAGPATRP